ncbi:putative bifunctional diguanylate cyclase/phosphodiesterase [Actinoplanes solisilvae]|uniref:putative bifunctional diguanylate cyclase/phosphodiesterase n=1 Tax=Actinoplanes solisilvae TaxID=2486853 RepID=UPI000FD7AE9C|nr:GGDEF and EAL domain-containing protein [Actinoplanes solisilvae]
MVTGTNALVRWLPTGGGLRDEDWAGRHRLMTRLLAASMVALLAFGALRAELGTNLTTWMVLLVLPCVVAAATMRGRRLPSIFVAFGFTVACAAFVALTHGQTEAHFTFFIAIAALALYRDWAPFGVFLIFTTAHHALFGVVDADLTYGHHSAQTHPLFWALVHGVAVLFAAAFQVVAWRLTEAEEKRAQDNLAESQAQLTVAFDETPVPMAIFNPDGRVLRTNSAYRKWMRLPDEPLRAGFLVTELPIEPAEPGSAVFDTLVRQEGSSVHLRQYRRKDNGELLWVEVHGTTLRDRDGGPSAIFVHCIDVTASRRHQEELQNQVRHDALTGLLSRSAFENDLAQLLSSRTRPVNVIYLDVDRFKSINDGAGHAAGDELLRGLATRLRATVPADALVARLGGDEFVVALAGGPEAGARVGHAILGAFAEPLELGDGHLQVSLSLGLAAGVTPEQADETVLSADTAMYAAKRAGGSRMQSFSDDMRVKVRERIAAEARLREALSGNLDETLPIWYQPIVATDTGRIVGAEALVRMRTPRGELLGPIQFIPAAEETGMIIPLGEHVLRLAVQHLLEWDEQLGYVSVNVSPRQLAEPDFVPMLAGLLSSHPTLDPARLVLEITETALLGSSLDVRERLETIKSLGVRIALDDFGTGYSSLTWLQSVPADVVKLDRSFVAGLSADAKKASIIQAVLWLASSLNMSVVAEGVEDPADWQALRAADCPSCQGYLFGKPMPAADFGKVLLPSRADEPVAVA